MKTREAGFEHLTIRYDDRVLQPRPWTASQSRWAAQVLESAPPGRVLELCTGAGHIGLLTTALTGRELVAVDACGLACDFARANAETAGLGDLVEVRHGTLESALGEDERFVLAIADPPWVPTASVTDFPQDPVSAIDGGRDGLDLARACIEVADRHLVPGGSLILQVGNRRQVEAIDRGVGALAVVEVREFPRGVLVRLDHALRDENSPAGACESRRTTGGSPTSGTDRRR